MQERTSHKMKPTKPTRRAVLQAGLGWAACPSTVAVARPSPLDDRTDRTLVMLHLAGGNDGLNTIIPYTNSLYRNLRPRLSHAVKDALPIDAGLAFHRSLAAMVPLFERGQLAVVQGVGYPDPDYSHIGSCQIWATGQLCKNAQRPWWESVLDNLPLRSKPGAVCVGNQPSAMMATTRSAHVHIVEERARIASRGVNATEHRLGRTGRTLAAIGRLVRSAHPPKLVFASVDGFDTHTDQLRKHAQLLRELSDGLAAFQHDLEVRDLADRVIVMAWSEFGRRPAENATGGTDHGSAGPVFVLGKKVRGGLYGKMPSLEDTDFGNLIPTVDFREVYATLADHWLKCPSPPICPTGRTLAFL